MLKNIATLAALLLLASGTMAADLATRHHLPTAPSTTECLACHAQGDYAKLAEKTQALTPNPHRSHMGDLECQSCHAWKGDLHLLCNDCHHFTYEKKAKAK